MTVALKKWGNSLALRIPKNIATTLAIEKESMLELIVENGRLIIVPQNKILLESLVAEIDSGNLHSEIDMGKRVGNEKW